MRPLYPKEMAGLRFGRWLVLSQDEDGRCFSKNRNGFRNYARWKCRCDCGKERTIPGHSLRNGGSKSCGCAKGLARLLPNGQAAKNGVLYTYKQNALNRHILWNLSEEEFITLTKQNCFYCGESPSKTKTTKGGTFTYNGIDRIDNDKGYVQDNVVACCNICNLAKRAMPFNNFVEWLKRAGQHQLEGELKFQTHITPVL